MSATDTGPGTDPGALPPPGLGTDHVLLDVADRVATLTLNRPAKLNAVTPDMSRALVRAIEWCTRPTTSGPLSSPEQASAPSASARTSAPSTGTPPRGTSATASTTATPSAPPVPRPSPRSAATPWAVDSETALSCDIRLAADTASFGAPEIALGWIGGGGMAAFLSRAAGPGNAALMLLTGERIDARRALDWHLVSEVVPRAGLLDRARALATVIASRAPVAAETAKINLRAAGNLPEDQALAYERDLQTVCFATEDAAEGRRAFAEKRTPVFRKR
ncbi:putative enoyl-CoA hydratase EchA17 OS=Streptomyces tendae OX=1932 GN=GUR47_36320 PE=3 SV=1 [Streptomyces tendae]